MHPSHLTRLPIAMLAAAALAAQSTTYIVPSGHATVEGNSNNTVPWWGVSGTYQQVHDASDLRAVFPSATVMIKGLGMRKDGATGTPTAARTLDLQITLGMTPVRASTATTSFATNLGPAPQIVLPYTNVSFPALLPISTPNPIGLSLPFTTPFGYVATSGNSLCYELRFKNNTSNDPMALDAVNGNPMLGEFLGAGCLASGQTTAAAIDLRSLALLTGQYRNRLHRGAAIAPAAFCFGLQRATLALPSSCSELQLWPQVTIAGTTDAAGSWDLQLTFGSIAGLTALSLYGQFAFLDAGSPHGIGLSNASVITLPELDLTTLSRIYAAPSGARVGSENATTGSLRKFYGLVTGFDI